MIPIKSKDTATLKQANEGGIAANVQVLGDDIFVC